MAKAPSVPPYPELKTFSDMAEAERCIARLEMRIEELAELRDKETHFRDPAVRTVESDIQNTILEVFGPGSPEYAEHKHFDIWDGGHSIYSTDAQDQSNFQRGIEKSIVVITRLIGRIKERLEFAVPSPLPIGGNTPAPGSVFVVHGRDSGTKETVARYLETLDPSPIVLREKPNEGRTIIEKSEESANVKFAVVLMTPDDVGCDRPAFDQDTSNVRPRARQNAVIEMGFVVGRLGRENVCAIVRDVVEKPSDIDGMLCIPLDPAGAWRLVLAKEMKQAGLRIDLNRAE